MTGFAVSGDLLLQELGKEEVLKALCASLCVFTYSERAPSTLGPLLDL